MDARTFDLLTRCLGRRGALRAVLGLMGLGGALAVADDAAAGPTIEFCEAKTKGERCRRGRQCCSGRCKRKKGKKKAGAAAARWAPAAPPRATVARPPSPTPWCRRARSGERASRQSAACRKAPPASKATTVAAAPNASTGTARSDGARPYPNALRAIQPRNGEAPLLGVVEAAIRGERGLAEAGIEAG